MSRALTILLLLLAAPVQAEDKEHKSYYQHTPSQVLQPLSVWNPLISERDGKVVKRSYLQYGPNNDVLKPGSLWNQIVTEKEKGK